jgi:hypothetical protein
VCYSRRRSGQSRDGTARWAEIRKCLLRAAALLRNGSDDLLGELEGEEEEEKEGVGWETPAYVIDGAAEPQRVFSHRHRRPGEAPLAGALPRHRSAAECPVHINRIRHNY